MVENSSIRLRFAPSPTGLLHLGGLRTALYNYLYAQHFQGKFIVRFEDTDQARNFSNAEESILKALRWIGLKIDETIDTKKGNFGPYRQSDRQEIYQQHIEQLLAQKNAYRCFCTTEIIAASRTQQKIQGIKAIAYDRRCWNLTDETIAAHLQAKKVFCVRLHIPENQEIDYEDLVYGKIHFKTANIDDFVLLKTTGIPTYNFAVVIDDHLMQISHVFRGSDHISNTPKQILLYQAFQWKIPQFAHLTLIRSNVATKISKRHFVPENFLQYYIDAGYLPIALANYLALLGWNPANNQEILTMPEMIAQFAGQELNKAESQFSIHKLKWINQQHLNLLTEKRFLQLAKPFLTKIAQVQNIDQTIINPWALSVWPQIACFADLEQALQIYFQNSQLNYNSESLSLFQQNVFLLKEFRAQIKQVKTWNIESIGNVLFVVQGKSLLTKKRTFTLLRIFLTNQEKGPRLRNLINLFGQNKILAITNHWLQPQKN